MRLRRIVLLALLWVTSNAASALDFTPVDEKLNAGDYEAALKVLKALPAETRIDLYGVLLRQAEISLGLGKAQLAEELFEEASFQAPSATEAQAGLTRALMTQGRFREAQAEARRALKESPGDVMLSISMAQLENRAGQVEAALARLEKISAGLDRHAVPGARSILVALAEILLERGRVTEARRRLKDWLAQYPNDVAVLDRLGQIDDAAGNPDEGARLRALTARLRSSTPVLARDSGTPGATSAPPTVVHSSAPRALPEVRFEPIPIPKGVSVSTGSGFIIDGGARVVTNAHVVGNARQLIVRNGIGQVRQARVEVLGKEDDLAILRLDTPYPAQWAIPRERIEEPRPGRTCYVLGYPLASTLGGTWPALTNGVVSRTEGGKSGLMQITAALNGGNSGGPVVDDQGRLIGIVVAKLDTLKFAEKHGTLPEDVNFAIRPSLLVRLLHGMGQGPLGEPQALSRMDAESIYELMLPTVVLVVANQG